MDEWHKTPKYDLRKKKVRKDVPNFETQIFVRDFLAYFLFFNQTYLRTFLYSIFLSHSLKIDFGMLVFYIILII